MFTGALSEGVVEGTTVLELSIVNVIDVMHNADVVVLKSRSGLTFVDEPFLCVGIGALARRELQGDGAFERGAFGFVDDTHAAFAELYEYLVV